MLHYPERGELASTRFAMTTSSGNQPSISVAQAGIPRKLGAGSWEVAFRVANAGNATLALLAAWLPHGRFRCGEQSLDGTPALGPGSERPITFAVAFDEAPGTEVENAFVILRLRGGDETWRVLARLTVTAGEDGAPHARMELITAHRVGFAG